MIFILVDEFVEIKINKRNRNYYKEKGYSCELGQKIKVKIKDLQKGTHIKIRYQCDYCGAIEEKPYFRFIEGRKIIEIIRETEVRKC